MSDLTVRRIHLDLANGIEDILQKSDVEPEARSVVNKAISSLRQTYGFTFEHRASIVLETIVGKVSVTAKDLVQITGFPLNKLEPVLNHLVTTGHITTRMLGVGYGRGRKPQHYEAVNNIDRHQKTDKEELAVRLEAELSQRALNRREAAEYCGVSLMTIDRALAASEIGHYRIGRRILFNPKVHLDAYLRRHEVVCKTN